MSILIEIIANGITTLGVCSGLFGLNKIYKYKIKPKMNMLGIYSWDEMHDDAHFHCPKCEFPVSDQPKICSCQDYHYEHFHFKCFSASSNECCEYSCIIRTKDDVD